MKIAPIPASLAWMALLALLLLQLSTHLPGPMAGNAPTPTPLPLAVAPRNPKLGVHTRLTDEVEPAKIRQTLQMVRAMGASWVTEYFPWSYIQPADRAHFDWTHSDAV